MTDAANYFLFINGRRILAETDAVVLSQANHRIKVGLCPICARDVRVCLLPCDAVCR